MPREARGISAATVKTVKPGRYGDGGGLYLLVRGPNAKFWSFRFVRGGKMQEIGLGPATGRDAVSLADARSKARELWLAHKAGRDPLAEKRAGRSLIPHGSKPWLRSDCWRRAKAGAIRTSKRSSSRSINTPRPRSAIESFS